jgi:hypothetical protein
LASWDINIRVGFKTLRASSRRLESVSKCACFLPSDGQFGEIFHIFPLKYPTIYNDKLIVYLIFSLFPVSFSPPPSLLIPAITFQINYLHIR